MLTNLDGLRPLGRDEDVAPVGDRVLDDNDHFGDEHIRSTIMPEATTLIGGLLASEQARGLEVTIFNPGLAPDRSLAERLSAFIADVVSGGTR